MKIGEERNADFGGCCPRRVTVLDITENKVLFQTRDLEKHWMDRNEFETMSYPIGGLV
jgi:hypothetical protein